VLNVKLGNIVKKMLYFMKIAVFIKFPFFNFLRKNFNNLIFSAKFYFLI